MAGLAQQAAGKPKPPLIQRQAQGMLDPIIAALTKAAMGRAQRSEQAIQGFTNSYANQLGQIHSAEPYANAEAGQASIDSALQQSLAGGGTDLASQLAQRLSGLQGSSGAGAVAQESGNLASQGQSAGNTRLASGSASLSALLANAANAGSYDRKAPGLAKLSGLQGIKQAEGNAQTAIDQGTLSAESQLPSLTRDLMAQNATNAYRQAEVGQGFARLGIEQQNANTAAARAAQTALTQDRSYGVALSRLGIEQKHLQLEALAAQAKLQGGGFTPEELVHLRKDAGSVIATARENNYTYAQVMNNMVASGIPVSIANKMIQRLGTPQWKTAMIPTGGYTGSKRDPFKGLGPLYQQAGGAPFRRRR